MKNLESRLKEILKPLINADADFVENYIDSTCWICGFPFSKKVRMDAVDQAKTDILELVAEEIEKLHTYGDSYKKDYHDMKDERDELQAELKRLRECVPEKIHKIRGRDCKCGAYGESECGCYADWSDWRKWNDCIDEIKKRMGVEK